METLTKSIIDNVVRWLKEHKSAVMIVLIIGLSLSLMFALGFVTGRLYKPSPLIIE